MLYVQNRNLASIQILAFADVINAINRTRRANIEKFNNLERATRELGLKVNGQKQWFYHVIEGEEIE